MTDFKPNDLVYWVFSNGDKSLCTVLDVIDDDRLRIVWHAHDFINIMPKKGFILAEDEE